jgi:DNA-directed RNA polymerase specialized sigma24 family protein
MSSLEVPLWWDREVDRTGRPIRADVREAAITVWKNSRRIQLELSDPSHAAELLEGTVAQISRYLEHNDIVTFSRSIEGLVAHSFQRAVQRETVKRNRFLPLNESAKLPDRISDKTWQEQVQLRLQLEEIIILLSDNSRRVLTLRYAGYTWKETAQLMGLSVAVLRSAFWRDVKRAKFLVQDRGTQQHGQL